MKFGLCLPIRLNADAQTNIKIAKRAEELGFDSIWASDHVIVPEKRLGTFSEYFYDPFVLLSNIAAVTSRIAVGTSVIILPYRNPVVVAKMIATLDVLSKGRVIFGVGPGWMKEEFEALGVPVQSRGRMTNEYIKAVTTLWREDAPEFDGEFCSFSDIKFFPKPVQQPRPPIWIAGASKYAVARAAALGDGWQPTWVTPEDVESGIAGLKSIAKENGRDLENFTFSVRNRLKILSEKDTKTGSAKNENDDAVFTLRGTPGEIREYINRYEETGVTHLVFDPAADDVEEIFYMMKVLADEIIPGFKDFAG